jgi:3-hydroxyisobutyrate dehydrogenase-like beta-hydroxyacid dehydrogenase
VKFPRFILDGSFDDGFPLDLMTKDLKVALQAAAEADHPMLSGSVVSQIWQAAANHGYGPEGHTSIYDFIERFYSGEEL